MIYAFKVISEDYVKLVIYLICLQTHKDHLQNHHFINVLPVESN